MVKYSDIGLPVLGGYSTSYLIISGSILSSCNDIFLNFSSLFLLKRLNKPWDDYLPSHNYFSICSWSWFYLQWPVIL